MKYTQNQAFFCSLLVVGLVLSPILENWSSTPKDNFPLSYYPMFSRKRKAVYRLYYFVGYDAQQNRHLIPYTYAGTGGFNQVRRQINRAAKSKKVDVYTRKIATKIAATAKSPFSDLIRIEFVKGYYHVEDYFLRSIKIPVKEKIISCISMR